MRSTNEAGLYQELAAKHGWPESKYLPSIFQRLVTPEQAKIMLQLTAPSEEIAKKLGMDKDVVENHLQELFQKGLAFPTKKGWRVNRGIIELHDLTLSNTKYWESYGGSEYADLWRAFEKSEWWPQLAEMVQSIDTPLARVVPAWEAIENNPERMPADDIREIYRTAESIVLIPCPCRRESYDRQCGSPDEICIALNRSAEYNLRRGVGKKLTVDEALALEKEARKHNLVTQVPNMAMPNTIVCHCHVCCCIGFLALFKGPGLMYKGLSQSRYLAEVVDPEKCTGCQKCIESCQFEAVEMKKYAGMTKWKASICSEKCLGCGNCVVKCPKKDTLILRAVRPPEHIPQSVFDMYAPTPR